MADILTLKKFETLSPFEIKNELIDLAKATSFKRDIMPAQKGADTLVPSQLMSWPLETKVK